MLTFIVIVMVLFVVGSKIATTTVRHPDAAAGIGKLVLKFFKK